MGKKIFVCFIVACFIFNSFGLINFAQARTFDEDWQQVKDDFEYIVDFPERMDGLSYATTVALLGAAGYMYAEKDKMRDWFQSNRTEDSDDLADVFKPLGKMYFAGGLAASLYLGGALFKNDRERETGLMLLESLIYTGAITGLGQIILAEDRPDEGGDMHFKIGGHGISGHAATAAALAGPINKQYLQITDDDTNFNQVMKYTGKAVVYGAPLLTSWSRLNDDDHFVWNCLLGSAIGFTIGELVANAHRKSDEQNLALAPFIEEDVTGVVVNYRF